MPKRDPCFRFPVMIDCCDNCPDKSYGLRRCDAADRWFDGEKNKDYFEPETQIAPWCPHRHGVKVSKDNPREPVNGRYHLPWCFGKHSRIDITCTEICMVSESCFIAKEEGG